MYICHARPTPHGILCDHKPGETRRWKCVVWLPSCSSGIDSTATSQLFPLFRIGRCSMTTSGRCSMTTYSTVLIFFHLANPRHFHSKNESETQMTHPCDRRAKFQSALPNIWVIRGDTSFAYFPHLDDCINTSRGFARTFVNVQFLHAFDQTRCEEQARIPSHVILSYRRKVHRALRPCQKYHFTC